MNKTETVVTVRNRDSDKKRRQKNDDAITEVNQRYVNTLDLY